MTNEENDKQSASTDFSCVRCGRPDKQLEKAPFKGALAEKVHSNVCQTCWHEWIKMGTQVINEMGLSLASPEAQTAYDQHMVEFLGLEKR